MLLTASLLLPELASAQNVPLLNVISDGNNQEYSTTLQILILLTGLSFLPAMLMVLTGFTRIIVVLSLMRQALGLQQTPPNPVLVGLALFLTAFIMMPVYDRIDEVAIQPWLQEELTLKNAALEASVPLKEFMLRQTRQTDLARMSDVSGIELPANQMDTPFRLMAPAFIISELKTAFQIGFLLFIPFLVIDMVVASVLMAMGMMMLSPLVISLPFKLMLFVLVDGWSLITGTLAASFW
ncbi:flagellar type III secretion system pore protein FliP [Sansalvadorimonas sp. 2012CJ34-2]|uniref:Flagellar biosynthetic protein FliP n=1 Tax=Parendozoicomonas callyspongiae TaxID=2942213 RepID=A0ABT0PFH6_9GAMM|nr:flagellar type III secretion system pore protein FliP [Sansalvadorimonas sp. 2012CJ34-2]MCL6270132.1 flagellar type III secretion system pore protein FliP [Sansalvadorimonas sp. 2012CJ34-2]